MGRFLYRFLRKRPFCDGNGRMARASSTLLLARDLPGVLLFEKPVGEVILEHREAYVNVLEHCDAVYEDLAEAHLPEVARLRRCERPFSGYYARAVSRAYYEHLGRARVKTARTKPALVKKPPPEMNLNFEAIRAFNP